MILFTICASAINLIFKLRKCGCVEKVMYKFLWCMKLNYLRPYRLVNTSVRLFNGVSLPIWNSATVLQKDSIPVSPHALHSVLRYQSKLLPPPHLSSVRCNSTYHLFRSVLAAGFGCPTTFSIFIRFLALRYIHNNDDGYPYHKSNACTHPIRNHALRSIRRGLSCQPEAKAPIYHRKSYCCSSNPSMTLSPPTGCLMSLIMGML